MVTHEIIGDDMQAVILTLNAGDEVRAEAGAMMFMTEAIEMDARMEGGLLGGLKRKLLAGESFFITHFRAVGQAGKVAISISASRSPAASAPASSAARVSSSRKSTAAAGSSSTAAAPSCRSSSPPASA